MFYEDLKTLASACDLITLVENKLEELVKEKYIEGPEEEKLKNWIVKTRECRKLIDEI